MNLLIKLYLKYENLHSSARKVYSLIYTIFLKKTAPPPLTTTANKQTTTTTTTKQEKNKIELKEDDV